MTTKTIKQKAYAVVNTNSSKKIQGMPNLEIFTNKKTAEYYCDFWNKEMWKGHSKVVEVTITFKA